MKDLEQLKYASIGSDQLLRFGLGMSKIGSQFSSSSEHVKNRLSVLDCASEYGKIFLDTASIYGGGFSETIIGQYIKKKRSQFFLATKFYPSETDGVEKIVENIKDSLFRLNTDCVDLLQVHWPNALFDDESLADLLMLIKEKGYCKYYGVCNYDDDEIMKLQNRIKGGLIASNQVELNMLTCTSFDRRKIESNQHLSIAYGVLNQGRLAASKKQKDVLVDIAYGLNIPIQTLVLAWALSYKNVLPLMKVSTIEHLKPLLNAFHVALPPLDIISIESCSKNNICYIDLADINLIGDGYRDPYLSELEARENSLNLFPSPISLARRFLDNGIITPLKVNRDEGGRFTIDSYDPIGQSKIYWGWKMAFPNREIPAYVLNN